jgi:REP element-mobilizing transposase RayT
MSVRKQLSETGGVYFITFTCVRWLPLIQLVNGYDLIYKWFDYLKSKGHYIISYVLMPNHIHVMIAFRMNSDINFIVGTGKRLLAYGFIKRLKIIERYDILALLNKWVSCSQQKSGKLHQVFQPSFDMKECRTISFMKQKANYIHYNPCRARLVKIPEEYLHSSAGYYYTGIQGIYDVITYMEVQDIDLS